MYFHHKRR
uniref:Uncharacterized protein n=1 Tax=Arundo donax TaxID=35708 RepID=A0A0A9FEE3_ARUDO